MEIKFLIGVIEGYGDIELPEYLVSLRDAQTERFFASGVRDFARVLEFFKGRRLWASAITNFSDSDYSQIDYFWLSSRKHISLTANAWDANFETVDKINPIDKGGWAPINIPVGLAYATKLKQPRDIALLMDACAELVVSEVFFEKLKNLDQGLRGHTLFTGIRKQSIAKGVLQLAIDQFALPAIISNAVGTVKGIYRKDIPGDENTHLGVPVLSRGMLGAHSGFMRSAEPWSGDLIPGWIVSKDIAERLAPMSKNVVLEPVLTEGTPLHAQHEEVWRKARACADVFKGFEWGGSWRTTDLAPSIRQWAKRGR